MRELTEAEKLFLRQLGDSVQYTETENGEVHLSRDAVPSKKKIRRGTRVQYILSFIPLVIAGLTLLGATILTFFYFWMNQYVGLANDEKMQQLLQNESAGGVLGEETYEQIKQILKIHDLIPFGILVLCVVSLIFVLIFAYFANKYKRKINVQETD